MKPALSLRHVSFNFGARRVLEDVSLEIMPGSLTAMIGPNGAGKSTVLRLMAGILKPVRGSVETAADIAYLPQISEVSRDFPLQVRQVVVSGLWSQLGERQPVTAALLNRAEAALAKVGLSDCAARQLDELSGGQFQRMLLARVLLQDAPIILLDEPFTAIDAEGQMSLMALVREWHALGRTLVCVTHDSHLVRQYFPQLVVCDAGRIWQGATHDRPALLQERMFA